jgi:hypothetical protein
MYSLTVLLSIAYFRFSCYAFLIVGLFCLWILDIRVAMYLRMSWADYNFRAVVWAIAGDTMLIADGPLFEHPRFDDDFRLVEAVLLWCPG